MAIPPMPTLVSPSGVSDPRALIEWGKEGWEERERCFEAWKRAEFDRDALIAQLAALEAFARGATAIGGDQIERIKALEHEVYALRLYGNKDCTAMADAYLADERNP